MKILKNLTTKLTILITTILLLTNCTNHLWTTGASPIEHIANDESFLKHEIQQFGKTENGLLFLKTENFYVLITENNSNTELYYRYLQADNKNQFSSDVLKNDKLINRITDADILKIAENMIFKIKIIDSIDNIKITEVPKNPFIITVDSKSIIRHEIYPNTILTKKILWTPVTLIADIICLPVQFLVIKLFADSFKP